MNRHDCRQPGLLKAASSTFIHMISSAPCDCYPSIHNTTSNLVEKLEGILGMEQAALSAQDRSQLVEYQSLLCLVLHSVLHKMDVMYIVISVMDVLMGILQGAQSNAFVLNNNNNPADKTIARSLGIRIIFLFDDFTRLLADSWIQHSGDVIHALAETLKFDVDLADPEMNNYLMIAKEISIKIFKRFIGFITAIDWEIEYETNEILEVMERIAAQQHSSEQMIGTCSDLVSDIARIL